MINRYLEYIQESSPLTTSYVYHLIKGSSNNQSLKNLREFRKERTKLSNVVVKDFEVPKL